MRARASIIQDYKRTASDAHHAIVCRELVLEVLLDIRDTLLSPNPLGTGSYNEGAQSACPDLGCYLPRNHRGLHDRQSGSR